MSDLRTALATQGPGGAITTEVVETAPSTEVLRHIRTTFAGPDGAEIGRIEGWATTGPIDDFGDAHLMERLDELDLSEQAMCSTAAVHLRGADASDRVVAYVELVEVAEGHRGLGLGAWMLHSHLLHVSEESDESALLVALGAANGRGGAEQRAIDAIAATLPLAPVAPVANDRLLAGIVEVDELEDAIGDASARIMEAVGATE